MHFCIQTNHSEVNVIKINYVLSQIYKQLLYSRVCLIDTMVVNKRGYAAVYDQCQVLSHVSSIHKNLMFNLILKTEYKAQV